MFEQSLLDLQEGRKTKTKYTVFISFVVETIILVIAVLIPMIYYDALPGFQLASLLVAPPPPPPPAPPPPVVKVAKIIPREFDAGKLVQPKAIPKKVAIIQEDALPPENLAGVVGGIQGGLAGGLIGGIISSAAAAPPPPPPPPPKVEAKAAAPQRIRVGGNVQKANLISQTRPVYPPLAKQARISGVVKLHAIIDKSGSIQELTVVSGHPLLIPAAMEAVKTWRYKPTLLNGEPVEVITEIDVNFTLNQ